MKKEMIIKGKNMGEGRPVVCVPVIARDLQEAGSQILELTEHQIEMVEWRLDWLDQEITIEEILAKLQQLKDHLTNTLLLCTFRTLEEGGQRCISLEEYLDWNEKIADIHVADFVDLEYEKLHQAGIAVKSMIAKLQERGGYVICSHHDFAKTPETEEMVAILRDIIDAGADFAKLAVMPESQIDVLRLMEAVLMVRQERPTGHVIAMSMGSTGAITRVLGGWFGSELTFASYQEGSAPGQLSYERTNAVLTELEICWGNRR